MIGWNALTRVGFESVNPSISTGGKSVCASSPSSFRLRMLACGSFCFQLFVDIYRNASCEYFQGNYSGTMFSSKHMSQPATSHRDLQRGSQGKFRVHTVPSMLSLYICYHDRATAASIRMRYTDPYTHIICRDAVIQSDIFGLGFRRGLGTGANGAGVRARMTTMAMRMRKYIITQRIRTQHVYRCNALITVYPSVLMCYVHHTPRSWIPLCPLLRFLGCSLPCSVL